MSDILCNHDGEAILLSELDDSGDFNYWHDAQPYVYQYIDDESPASYLSPGNAGGNHSLYQHIIFT